MILLQDSKGRISGFPVGILYKKVTTDADNAYIPVTLVNGVDLRPRFDWQRVNISSLSFSVSGKTEIGLIFNLLTGNYTSPITVTVNGTPVASEIGWETCRELNNGQILWGTSGLDPTVTYNIVISGITSCAVFVGYFCNGWTAPPGTSITYRVGSETCSIIPYIDRKASYNTTIDAIIAKFSANPTKWNNTTIAAIVAGYAYFLKDDSIRFNQLKTLASTFFDAGYDINNMENTWDTYFDWDVTGTEQVSSTGNILIAGRLPYEIWVCWKAFGDTKYLTALDACITYLRANWTNPWEPGSGSGNSGSAAAFSCALAWNEPALTNHYHDDAFKTVILENADRCVEGTMSPNGAMNYGSGGYYGITDRLYGAFSWIHYRTLSEMFNWNVSDVNKMTHWLAGNTTYCSTNIPFKEPYPYYSMQYHGIHHWVLLGILMAQYKANGSVDSALVDQLFYSAAAAHMPGDAWASADGESYEPGYNPTGFASDSMDNEIFTFANDGYMGFSMIGLISLGIPKSVWAWDDSTAPNRCIIDNNGVISPRSAGIVSALAFSGSNKEISRRNLLKYLGCLAATMSIPDTPFRKGKEIEAVDT